MMPLTYAKQRGVALITAVLMVALATILAVEIGFKGYLNQRRAVTLFTMDQGYEGALGAEALAAEVLMLSAKDPRTDASQMWAKPQQFPFGESGDLAGYIEDMGGRFNLNLLADTNPAGQSSPSGQPSRNKHQEYIDQFKRILEMAQLEPEWADKIADWVDADGDITYPDGGEDNLYAEQSTPYRTANQRITRVSELLSLPNFGMERYRKLEPLVSALPADATINVCTAPAIVLDSFSISQRQYSLDTEGLAKHRSGGCFPDKKALANALIGDEQVRFNALASETSSYFRATVVVTIGSNRFTLYSLLKRDAAGVRPITRSFGTP